MTRTKSQKAQFVGILVGAPLALVVIVVVLVVAWAGARLLPSQESPVPVWQTLPAFGPQPDGGRSGYAEVNAVRVYYTEYGSNSAAPVLLLHGGLADSSYWNRVVPALVAHGRRVIVADSRGHGRSTRTEEPYSYGLMAQDVLALMDYLKIPAADLVGWSDGGIIGVDIAIHHPDRLTSLFAYGANTNPDGLIPGGDQAPVSLLGVERAHSEYLRVSPTPDQWDRFNSQINKMWDTQPNISTAELRSVHVRTLIADGQYDEVIKREHTEYLAGAIPGAKLEILPDVSHFGMLQDAEEFNRAVLAFLG